MEKYKISTLKTKVSQLDTKICDATTLIHIYQYKTDRQNLGKKIRDVHKKIPDVSNLVTTTVLNTKLSEVKSKKPVVSDLVKKADYESKTLEIVVKYITTSHLNKFASEILDVKIKQKNLVNKSNISILVKKSILNTKLTALATKTELKAVEDKILKLQAFDSSYFRVKKSVGNDGLQNMFVYQPIFNMLELKKDNSTDHFTGWKSKNLFESKLLSLHGAFLPNAKFFGYRITIESIKFLLV